MTTRKVWDAGAWVTVASGAPGLLADVAGPVLTDGAIPASTDRTKVNCKTGTAPNVPGAWQELAPALSDDVSGISIFTGSLFTPATNMSTLLEIGLGGAGAEVTWAQVQIGYNNVALDEAPVFVPGHIAAGTRVAGRTIGATANRNVNVVPYFHASPSPVTLGAPVMYGVNVAASKGTTLAAPGSLNVKGAWTEITPATAVDLVALSVQLGLDGRTSTGAGRALVDVGYGPAGSEVVLIADLLAPTTTSPDIQRQYPPAHAVTIPVGTRLVGRFARSAGVTFLDMHLIGTPAA